MNAENLRSILGGFKNQGGKFCDVTIHLKGNEQRRFFLTLDGQYYKITDTEFLVNTGVPNIILQLSLGNIDYISYVIYVAEETVLQVDLNKL